MQSVKSDGLFSGWWWKMNLPFVIASGFLFRLLQLDMACFELTHSVFFPHKCAVLALSLHSLFY